ncbi:eukaryotic translation initiation factor 4E [Brettanomyces bruxellensis]|uniref:DEBR0S2_09274g1_1 n=1 Tax=Dekkera bruxellensis TaxID=5007 RepID=A0A7D9CXD7_DEKBR|nr:eukaryotic translation initiation factor 4E [Brettanomyces bruxellensis]KAF6010048.1 eukaryotic translation initiation factor 4E [Brettanomyces bruxellensis]KAF6014483.1 eukaryotic translation initiation factor 4E [Brettanomyces bruxellensis]QOU18537.1 eukaryotic translation initiation factor 4E [Brettanomyces bruxellensis]VUG17513.1 CDC33 [Brettanomyces bruxellensis]
MSEEEINKKTAELSLEDKKEEQEDKAKQEEKPVEAEVAKPEEEKKDVTVLENKEEFTVKHPLNSKWTLWYTKPAVDKNESWADLLKPIVSFDTVEEFWGIYHAVPKAVDLPLKSDYHLFRNDIKPEWEDTANAEGGKWSHQFRSKNIDIHEIWTRALLSVIGETIEDDDQTEVNGVVLNVRRNGFKIGLWTKSCDIEKLKPIGTRFKKVLKLSDRDTIEFMKHNNYGDRNAAPLITM